MTPKNQAANEAAGTIKPTGVNEAIKDGLDPNQFQGRVICKKCGKDIEFTKGSELFLRCPRCHAKVERDLKEENQEVQKVIKYDLLRRSKRYLLQIGFVLTCIAIAYCAVGFFSEWFTSRDWWLALLALPFVAISFAFTRITRLKSATKRYRVFAWLALILNVIALAFIVVTAVPDINNRLHELYVGK